jgi:Asp-tRNA(Asn)/Glu-tRNA(Gln) amidotransferase A subunit family amidase
LGIPEGPYLEQADSVILSSFRSSIGRLKKRGIEIKQIPIFADIDEINTLHKNIVAVEFAYNHAAMYARYGHLYAPQSRELVEKGRSLREETLLTAVSKQTMTKQRLRDLMLREGIAGWICPASRTPPPRGITSTGDPIMNLPWTFTGMPAISIPVGFGEHNLPLSSQLVAGYDQDAKLLQMAKVISKILTPQSVQRI